LTSAAFSVTDFGKANRLMVETKNVFNRCTSFLAFIG